jgi:hypothetical protein
MIVGLSSTLPATLHDGLVAHHVSEADATRVANLPPVSTLFAAFLGYNPMQTLLGPHVLHSLPAADAHALTGHSFFPQLISGPFASALDVAFTFALIACVVAAVASALRGGQYHYEDESRIEAATRGEAIEPLPAGIASALTPSERSFR